MRLKGPNRMTRLDIQIWACFIEQTEDKIIPSSTVFISFCSLVLLGSFVNISFIFSILFPKPGSSSTIIILSSFSLEGYLLFI